MATQIIDLGKIRWSWQGDFSSGTEYELNDVVRYGGGLYICISEVPVTGILPTVTATWSNAVTSTNWRGVYNGATAYRPGDVVSYGGPLYINTAPTTGNVPTNASFWNLYLDGLQFKGEYSALTAYKRRDVVKFGGSAYIAVLDGTGNVPTDVTYWAVLVDGYPDLTGNANKVLTNNGTTTSWTDTVTLDTLTVTDKFTSDLTYIGDGAEAFETSAELTDAALVINTDGGSNSFAQVAFHNAEPTSSTDIIAYASNGDDSFGWVGMGITGDKFDDTTYGITGQGDAYIFAQAPETSAVKSITNKALTDNVATLTSTAHGFLVGQRVVVSGVDATFNGVYTITAKTDDTFSYAKVVGNVSPTAVSPAGSAKIQSAGNLVIATGDEGTDNNIVFAAGGYASGNTQMVIIPDTQVHVEIATASTSPTTGALVVAGGVGITGDTFTDGDLTLDGILYVGPGAENFSTTAQLTDPAIVTAITGGASSFAQVAFTNTTATSSTDLILYMNNGNDSNGWVGMGITGSQFDDTTYGITGPGDAYIFHDTLNNTYTGNLVFATGDSGSDNKIIFAAGGFASGDTQMEITPGVNIHIEIPTPSTSPTTGALTIVGGVGIQGDMNIQGNVAIAGTITFGGSGTTVETSNLAVTDPAVFVGTNNQSDIVDLSFIGEYATTTSPIVASVTNKALTSNIATLTTASAHTYLEGDVVTITGVDATFNGTYNIKTVPTTTTFTYAKTAANVTSVAVSPTGTATVNARRKFAGIARDATDGIIKVFRDATTKPVTTVNFAEAGLTFAPVRLGALTTDAITASGAISTTSTLASTGNFSVNSTSFQVTAASGNTSVGGTLAITSDLTVATNKFTVAASSGNTAVAGTLDVTGNSTLTGNLTTYGTLAVGTIAANNFTVAPSTGNTSIAGTLVATGAITANGGITSNGASSFTGTTDVQELREQVVDVTLASNVGTLNWASGNIFYIETAPTANMTFNVTNVPTDVSKIMTINVMVTQGATGRVPATFQINGVGQTIRWVGGSAPTPTSSAGKIDIFSFSMQRTSGGNWIVYATSALNF